MELRNKNESRKSFVRGVRGVRYHTLPVTSFFWDQDEYGKEKRGKGKEERGGNVLESLLELGGSNRAHSLG